MMFNSDFDWGNWVVQWWTTIFDWGNWIVQWWTSSFTDVFWL